MPMHVEEVSVALCCTDVTIFNGICLKIAEYGELIDF